MEAMVEVVMQMRNKETETGVRFGRDFIGKYSQLANT